MIPTLPRRPAALIALTALLMAAPFPAPAGGEKDGGEDIASEQQLRLKQEWARARAVGGYPDPLSAFAALLRGEPIPGSIQPHISDPYAYEYTLRDGFREHGWLRAE